ncbi:MAG: SMP-30/gluconolactonase/LRE family protein [Proteobacteria bacterium]|jgi:gluconolactonase|nr:SMP-30/gluconolactonase/LRE family protein [Pseudomonadota bacterium]
MGIKRSVKILQACFALVLSQQVTAQQSTAEFEISDLVAAGASVTKLSDGFVFTEGPAVDTDGNVYFSDVRTSKAYKWSVDGELTTFREQSGGSNGMHFDQSGNLLVCESGERRITRVSMDGSVTVLADSYDGKKLNSPNDIWPDPKGGIYFSDPRFRDQTGVEQDGYHVYYIPSDGTPVQRVVDNLEAPNGVLGTADGSKLYVADHGPETGSEMTYIYDIQPDGSLANRQLAAPQGSDGMTLDEHGNLYLTSEGVDIYSQSGEKIVSIEIPERPTNVVFGGADRQTLFITARTGIYSLKMMVRGQ